MTKTLFAFDLYGTLLSTASIAKALTEHYGAENAESMQAVWRKYQLEYTWRLNSMKQYEDFDIVTRKALRHTLAEHDLETKSDAVDSIMQAYDNLSTFPDVVHALEALKEVEGVECVVFSNGTRKMVENSVKGSDDLKAISSVFSQLVSVEHMQSYKPAPEVYKFLAHCVGMPGQESNIWLVSGNPFDVVGARAVGMNAAWVDRAGNGWQDKLGKEPTKVIHGLGDLVDLVKQA